MKTEKNILIAFILNLSFSIFEFFGGVFSGSIAIVSDAIHDMGDAASIGVAFFLEKKSKKEPDDIYTYGYRRYSVIGGTITTLILLFGSLFVIYKALLRIAEPVAIDHNRMIIFAIVGISVNLTAAILTRKGNSLNQKAVNLHMLEDVLGWVVVLVGAIIIKFTSFYIIDPLMSIGVATFILFNALKNLKDAAVIFLEKAPDHLSANDIKKHVCALDGVLEVHHIHVWSIDGYNNYATMHVVVKNYTCHIKEKIRCELKLHSIQHVTLEIEEENEPCQEKTCDINTVTLTEHHHHHKH